MHEGFRLSCTHSPLQRALTSSALSPRKLFGTLDPERRNKSITVQDHITAVSSDMQLRASTSSPTGETSSTAMAHSSAAGLQRQLLCAIGLLTTATASALRVYQTQ